MRIINKIIVHNSLTPRDLSLEKSVQSFNRTHKARLHPKKNSLGFHIAYHIIIGADGKMKQTRGFHEVGYHASNWWANKTSIGICLLGNFDKEEPTDEQLATLQRLISNFKKQFKIKASNVYPHKKYASYKSCPGKNLNDNLLSQIASGTWETEYNDKKGKVSSWAEYHWDKAIKNEILDLRNDPQAIVDNKKLELILKNMKGLTKITGKLTLERLIVALYNINTTQL